jgi:hypothetical protein
MNTLPSDINPGIRRTVLWLRSFGFETCDSGDGETHMAACDRAYPYVTMKASPERMVSWTNYLKTLLAKRGIELKPQGMAFNEEGVCVHPCVQATFDPGDGTALIDLMGVSDALLPAEPWSRAYEDDESP